VSLSYPPWPPSCLKTTFLDALASPWSCFDFNVTYVTYPLIGGVGDLVEFVGGLCPSPTPPGLPVA
jgi:hypothetical protein